MFDDTVAFVRDQLILKSALSEISIEIQVFHRHMAGKVFLHHMAFVRGQLCLKSALSEISVEILERFFFLIWLLARGQLSLKSTLSDISIEQH